MRVKNQFFYVSNLVDFSERIIIKWDVSIVYYKYQGATRPDCRRKVSFSSLPGRESPWPVELQVPHLSGKETSTLGSH
jgi:hypothetical protein